MRSERSEQVPTPKKTFFGKDFWQGVDTLIQVLPESLAEQGTEVFSIHPGPISTDMGAAAGLADIAKPPSLVAEALVAAMAKGDFHVFPDSMARQIGEAYAGFAAGVIEAAGGEE